MSAKDPSQTFDARSLGDGRRKLARDVGLDRLGRGDVGVAAGVALQELDETTAVKRSRMVGKNLQRRVELGDGTVEVTFFAPDSGAVVVGIDRPVGVGNGAVE